MSDRSNRQRLRDDFSAETGGYQWRPWRWALGLLGVVVLVILTIFVVRLVFTPLSVAGKVTNPDKVIFDYERFHDLCAGIAAKDQQYETALGTAERHDKRTKGEDDPLGRNAAESARLHQVADGIRLARQQDAQAYNADSRKLTRAPFKARDLPYRIEDGVTPECDGGPVA